MMRLRSVDAQGISRRRCVFGQAGGFADHKSEQSDDQDSDSDDQAGRLGVGFKQQSHSDAAGQENQGPQKEGREVQL